MTALNVNLWNIVITPKTGMRHLVGMGDDLSPIIVKFLNEKQAEDIIESRRLECNGCRYNVVGEPCVPLAGALKKLMFTFSAEPFRIVFSALPDENTLSRMLSEKEDAYQFSSIPFSNDSGIEMLDLTSFRYPRSISNIINVVMTTSAINKAILDENYDVATNTYGFEGVSKSMVLNVYNDPVAWGQDEVSCFNKAAENHGAAFAEGLLKSNNFKQLFLTVSPGVCNALDNGYSVKLIDENFIDDRHVTEMLVTTIMRGLSYLCEMGASTWIWSHCSSQRKTVLLFHENPCFAKVLPIVKSLSGGNLHNFIDVARQIAKEYESDNYMLIPRYREGNQIPCDGSTNEDLINFIDFFVERGESPINHNSYLKNLSYILASLENQLLMPENNQQILVKKSLIEEVNNLNHKIISDTMPSEQNSGGFDSDSSADIEGDISEGSLEEHEDSMDANLSYALTMARKYEHENGDAGELK